jgi:hypothetical protein
MVTMEMEAPPAHLEQQGMARVALAGHPEMAELCIVVVLQAVQEPDFQEMGLTKTQDIPYLF